MRLKVPRFCRDDSGSVTFRAVVYCGDFQIVTTHTKRGFTIKPHEMGQCIPRGPHSQVAQKNGQWRIAPTSRRGVRQAGATRKAGSKRASPLGLRAHVDFDSTEYALSQVVGCINGKRAIHLARVYIGRSTTTPLCGYAGDCASSTRLGDAGA